MTQKIVALTGISGVGKTTFLQKLSEALDFQHVTGGTLIAAAREATPKNRDAIRYENLDENQRFLIEGFALTRDPNAKIVVMDGHAVIDDGQRLSEIPCDVFEALDISVMVHLEGDPEQIVANRRKDTSRSRPSYSLSVLEQHQVISRAHAKSVAETLEIPFYVVTHNDIDRLVEILVSN